ncbi:MAG: hypothetical protein JOZ07_14140 [Solirubrobacterales bacterium]|nr:hypothetical protein [Solirubrobacterales bacterium]
MSTEHHEQDETDPSQKAVAARSAACEHCAAPGVLVDDYTGRPGELVSIEWSRPYPLCQACLDEGDFIQCRECGRYSAARYMIGFVCEDCSDAHPVGCACEGCVWEYGGAVVLA